jgi:DNA primase
VAGSVPEQVLQQVARGVDFVRLAGRYCELKKKGRSYWALCPFHKEKTPSFSLDPESGLYFCFGCKEGGNVFTFLEKMEGITFAEALRRLASEAGVDLSQYRGQQTTSPSELSRLREANELATSFYQKCLLKARGSQKPREYLAARGIKGESVERWRLGFAPDGWDHLLKCAVGRGHEPELLVKAGLAIAREGNAGHYDRFRNRLMFPIGDATGRTIGFGARALRPEDEPKYLNSPDTPLFSKGTCFFGLSEAKQAIRSAKTAVVVEGYTDVIMAHQAGVSEAVAVLGTALTEEHGRAISRLCERVMLVFDGDEAGLKSALRSIEVLLNEEVDIQVVDLPAGQDPCDYVLANGGEAFRQRLAESQGFFEFRLAAARREHDTGTVAGATAAFRDLAEMALLIKDQAQQDMVVRRIAQELGLREANAWAYLARRRRSGTGRFQSPADVGEPRLSADQELPGELLGLLLEHPDLLPEAAERIDAEMLHDCPEKQLVQRLLSGSQAADGEAVREFMNALTDPALASAACGAQVRERLMSERITAATARDRFEDYVSYLERKRSSAVPIGASGLDEPALRALEQKLRAKDRQNLRSK